MGNIIRTESGSEGGLSIQYIFGTGIFTWNKVENEQDVQVEFLKELSRQNIVSAHTRLDSHFAPSPEELFGPSREGLDYEIVKVGPDATPGKFYESKIWPASAPCFFPQVSETFWQTLQPRADETWLKLLSYDAVVFYIAPLATDFNDKMSELFENSSETTENWLERVLDVYRIAIMSGGDMNYFKAYAKEPEHFDIFEKPIRQIEEMVAKTPWFRENEHKLVWDGESGMCLVLPSSM